MVPHNTHREPSCEHVAALAAHVEAVEDPAMLMVEKGHRHAVGAGG